MLCVIFTDKKYPCFFAALNVIRLLNYILYLCMVIRKECGTPRRGVSTSWFSIKLASADGRKYW